MKCVNACPTNALKAIGEEISANDLFDEIIKDKAYFGHGGGVTLSGGEILLQAKEALSLIKRLKSENIHIAIDTSGYSSFETLKEVIPYTDLFLYDLKLFSETRHMDYCGTKNQLIKDNLIRLSRENAPLWIRTPIIPTATDSNENIFMIASFLKENEINFERWELCAFNNLCKDKYARLNIEWKFKDEKLLTKRRMNELVILAKSVFEGKENNIIATGVTQLEDSNE